MTAAATTRPLHVYVNGIVDSVVAESPEHALQLLTAHLVDMGSDGPDELASAFTQEPDDKLKTITRDDENHVERPVTKTCAEWAVENGPGFLCSTEW